MAPGIPLLATYGAATVGHRQLLRPYEGGQLVGLALLLVRGGCEYRWVTVAVVSLYR